MSEQSTPAPEPQDEQVDEQNTAPVDADGTSESESEDWQVPDYSDLPEPIKQRVADIEREFKSQYTKKTQSLADQRKTYEAAQEDLELLKLLRTDPEYQKRTLYDLADVLGVELPEVGEETEVDEEFEEGDYADDLTYEDPRLTQLLQEREQERLEREAEEFFRGLAEHMEQEYAAAEKALGRPLDPDEKAMLEAYGLYHAEDNQPQIRKGVDLLRKLESGWQTRYIDSKKAPHVQHGIPGSEKVDLTNEAERQAHMLRLVQARQQENNNT